VVAELVAEHVTRAPARSGALVVVRPNSTRRGLLADRGGGNLDPL